jgi:uncharacterized protein (DUF1697 family)
MVPKMKPQPRRTWIILFRGINVGGHNIVPMAGLRKCLEAAELDHVRSYIQSGNVAFDVTWGNSVNLSRRIGDSMEGEFGFRPDFLLYRPEHIQQAVDANPFPNEVEDPKSLHYLFLAKPPTEPDLEAIEQKKSPTESYHLTDSVFYLHAPDGIGRSKLAASAAKHLGVVATGRNHRTVDKILSMINP